MNTEKMLCHHCIEETYLKSLVFKHGDNGDCNFCGTSATSFTLGKLSEIINEIFQNHYMMSFPDLLTQEQNGQPSSKAIMNLGGFPSNAAAQIREILEDEYYNSENVKEGELIPFAVDTYYVENISDVRDLEVEWKEFERTLKTEARFFNTKGYDLLKWIFGDINDLTTKGAKKAIVKAGPGHQIDHLFRARTFQSTQQLQKALADPVAELGPPPWRVASPGRMNAQGVSVFYGANMPNTAITEVRPPVGSEVIVAKFEVIRELSLLDLTSFPELHPKGSLFDPVYSEQLRKNQFLKNLSRQIAVPIMPDDQAHEYLVTQAISDFLSTEKNLTIDGIIYPSVQTDDESKNIILFHKSSRVEEINYPDDIKVSGRLWNQQEDGYKKMYIMKEEKISNEKLMAYRKINPWGNIFGRRIYNHDVRKAALKIDIFELSVHEIKSIRYNKIVHPVKIVQEDNSGCEGLPF